VNEAKEKPEYDGWLFTRVTQNGWIGKNPDGKVKKSPSFSPPDFSGILNLN
jgi:hypothetical protein